MALDKLPQELIYEIVTHLRRSRDLVALALRTYNKQVYSACRPFLQSLAEEAKRRNTMITRFGLSPNKRSHMERLYQQLGLWERYGPYKPPNEHDTVEFLGPLDGDFSWLGSQNYVGSRSWDPRSKSNPLLRRRIPALSQQAKRVGVVFPECFSALCVA